MPKKKKFVKDKKNLYVKLKSQKSTYLNYSQI